MDVEQLIRFLKETEKFKTCERTCRTTTPGRAESDAEHSWHLALLLLLLEKELPAEINFAKVMKLALVHDLPEIYAGDTNPYRSDTRHKEKREKEAAKALFSMLPEGLSSHMTALVEDYIHQESPEAKIVKSADKLLPLIQNLCTNGTYSSYRRLEVTYAEVAEYMNPFFITDDILKRFYDVLLEAADKAGVFFREAEPPEEPTVQRR